MMKKNEDGTFSGILSDWDLAVRVKDENGEFIELNRRQRYRTVSSSSLDIVLC